MPPPTGLALSPQANTPLRKTAYHLLEQGPAVLKTVNLQGPKIIDGVGGTATTVFTGSERSPAFRMILNCGTTTVKVAFGGTAASEQNFQEILPGGVATDDGLGGRLVMQLNCKVSIYCASNYRVAVTDAYDASGI